MTSKEIVKQDTDTAISPFVVINTPITEIREAVAVNLQGSGMGAADLERIKIPAGGGTAWTLQGIDGEEMVKELSGIIVAWRDTRAYWSVPMEQSEASMRPDCYSLDARTGIGTPGGDCHQCAFAQFGSDPKGEGQACKLIRQLFFVREENMLPEIVSLPASSLKPARQYFLRLASKGVPCFSLITRICLEKTKNAKGIVYSRATFASGGRLSTEQADRVRAYAELITRYIGSAPLEPTAKDVPQREGEVI